MHSCENIQSLRMHVNASTVQVAHVKQLILNIHTLLQFAVDLIGNLYINTSSETKQILVCC